MSDTNADLFEQGQYAQQKRAGMLKHVLNSFRPDEMGDLLADYLGERFGRNVGEMVLMDARDRMNKK